MTYATLGLQVRLFLIAVQSCTRLPVTGRLAGWVGAQHDWAARATRYFPLVGALVGMLAALVYATAGGFLPHGVSVLVAMGAGLLLTGARHEAQLARFCDAAGRSGREAAGPGGPGLGIHGAVGVAMVLLGRFETLASLDPEWIASALVAAHALSRGCAVAVMGSLAPLAAPGSEPGLAPNLGSVPNAGSASDLDFVSDRGVGADRHAPTPMDIGIALVTATLPAAVISIWTGDPGKFAIGVVLAALVTLWLRHAARKRLGGRDAACLGTVQQAAELAFYVGLLGGLVLGSEALGDPTT